MILQDYVTDIVDLPSIIGQISKKSKSNNLVS